MKKTHKKEPQDYYPGLVRAWFFWSPTLRQKFKIRAIKDKKSAQELFLGFAESYAGGKDA